MIAALLGSTLACERDPATGASPAAATHRAQQPSKRPVHDAGESQAVLAAAAAVDTLRRELGAALRGALSEGGAAEAIKVCRDDAPAITRALQGSGIELGRTSHRLRNPANAPQPWVKPLLAEFEKAPPQPGSFRVVELGERGTGYVEPIYLQPLCGTCHGQHVATDLLARIRAHYPEDQAIGFGAGGFRGLFWAVIGDPVE